MVLMFRSALHLTGKNFIFVQRSLHPAPRKTHLVYINFDSSEQIHQFLEKLSQNEREKLAHILTSDNFTDCFPAKPLNIRQLWIAGFANSLPFVGFGFFDNALMITAGGSIENLFGAVMGLSTMAAAAIGNWISDTIGMGTAGYIEAFCHKTGIRAPDMTSKQMNMFSTRFSIVLGRCIGMTIGCFIGMFPLVFFDY